MPGLKTPITEVSVDTTVEDVVAIGSPLDSVTGAILLIDYVHHEIHEGNHYFVSGFESENAAGTIIFGVTTPNSAVRVHMTFEIQGTSRLEVAIREGATIADGAAATPINSNRNSTNTSALTVVKDPSISVAGTLIHSESRGLEGDNKIPSNSALTERRNELVLKANTTYTFTITSRDNGNIITYMGHWYEHTES